MKRLMSKAVCVVAVAVAVVRVSLDDLSPPASPFSPSRWRSSAPFPPDFQGFEPATTCRRPDISFCSFPPSSTSTTASNAELQRADDGEIQSDGERLAHYREIKLCFISNAMFSALWCFSLICEHSVLPPVIHGRELHVSFQPASNTMKSWVGNSCFRCFSTVQSSDSNKNGAQSCTQGGRNWVNAAASL